MPIGVCELYAERGWVGAEAVLKFAFSGKFSMRPPDAPILVRRFGTSNLPGGHRDDHSNGYFRRFAGKPAPKEDAGRLSRLERGISTAIPIVENPAQQVSLAPAGIEGPSFRRSFTEAPSSHHSSDLQLSPPRTRPMALL